MIKRALTTSVSLAAFAAGMLAIVASTSASAQTPYAANVDQSEPSRNGCDLDWRPVPAGDNVVTMKHVLVCRMGAIPREFENVERTDYRIVRAALVQFGDQVLTVQTEPIPMVKKGGAWVAAPDRLNVATVVANGGFRLSNMTPMTLRVRAVTFQDGTTVKLDKKCILGFDSGCKKEGFYDDVYASYDADKAAEDGVLWATGAMPANEVLWTLTTR